MKNEYSEEEHKKCDESNTQFTDESTSNSSTSQSNRFFGSYIPGGFQTLNPEIFNIIGEILGDVIAGRIPFNMQNALGNWIQLIGQTIETYSAQQNYFQSGPGRFYDLKYYNVTNPFMTNNEQETNNSKDSSNSHNDVGGDQLSEIRNVIEELQKDIKCINERINRIENINSNHNL